MPTFVGASAASATNGSAPAPALPAGLQDGDLIVCAFYSRENADGTVGISAGWQQRVNHRDAGGLLAVWGRKWQAGVVAPTLSLTGHATGNSGDSAIAQIAAFRPDVSPATPLIIESPVATNASQQNIGPIGGLTILPGDVCLVVGGKRDDWTSANGISGEGLAWSEIGEPDTTSGADSALVWAYAINDGSSRVTVTPKTFAATGGSAAEGKGVMFVLSLPATASLGAEYLCKAVNVTHPDSTKDDRGCYKRGDFILVKPLGHEWGGLELLPPAEGGKFARIVISDVTHDWLANVIRNKWSNAELCEPYGVVEGVTLRRRRIRIDIDLLPAGVLNTLNTTGVYITDFATVRAFVRDKILDQTL